MRRTTSLALAVVLLSAAIAAADPSDIDRTIAAALQSAYSLDMDDALAAARKAVAMAPDSPRAHRTLASVLWLDILFQRGAVTIDYYLGDIVKGQQRRPKPPADLDAEFKDEISRAIGLASARLEQQPRDLDARDDIGTAYGLQASYSASIEGSMTSAFLAARRAFDAEETVLDRDPSRIGAGLVVGTYRYVVSGLALPSRLVAYIAGMGGGKSAGIALVQAATRSTDASVEAKTALALIYSREGRHEDAMRLLGELSAEFPRNRLFVLEQGSAAIRAGHASEADALLTRGLDTFAHDNRPKIPGEKALWLYKRGLARLNMNTRADALADLNAAMASGPEPQTLGRIRLARGKIADLDGRRGDAVSEYRLAKQAADAADDRVAATDAARWLKEPFTFNAARH